MTIRNVVLSELQSVTEEFSPLPFPENFSDETLLDTLRLDSIALTSFFVRIEENLGFIPSKILDEGAIPQTLGQLIQLYEAETNEKEIG